ncbi:MAG TPA: DoxX family protein [Acidobacteriaceae bacterium]|nr:DoxX family protein [Acidobacteriaceae bacterium]
MKSRAIAYWTATALLTLELLIGSIWDLSRSHLAVQIMLRLGYPLYLLALIGIWKLLAIPALLVPGYARLKEWTYAGIFFLMTGAIASHAACGDGKGLIPPLILLSLAITSWMLRAGNRAWAPSTTAEARA